MMVNSLIKLETKLLIKKKIRMVKKRMVKKRMAMKRMAIKRMAIKRMAKKRNEIELVPKSVL